uniref:Uncharacterized protein n=1 Tax=Ditylenchus dipsaci TaxID=166011 RepID=A0A915DYY1_9BILA
MDSKTSTRFSQEKAARLAELVKDNKEICPRQEAFKNAAQTVEGKYQKYEKFPNGFHLHLLHHTSQSAETCKFGQDNNYHLENQLKTLRLHGSSTKRQKFPLSTHSPWHPNNIEDQQKETMSKQEIEDLRSSVLRTNRPVNPWFDAQKKMSPTPHRPLLLLPL